MICVWIVLQPMLDLFQAQFYHRSKHRQRYFNVFKKLAIVQKDVSFCYPIIVNDCVLPRCCFLGCKAWHSIGQHVQDWRARIPSCQLFLRLASAYCLAHVVGVRHAGSWEWAVCHTWTTLRVSVCGVSAWMAWGLPLAVRKNTSSHRGSG